LESDEVFEAKIKSNTNLSLGDSYLVYTEPGLFVVQILLVGGKPSHYLMMTGSGELVHRTIESEILKLDKTLRSLIRFDLKILESVILKLLDLGKRSIPKISKDLNETEHDVSVAVQELKSVGLLNEESVNGEVVFSLKTDMETLSELVSKYALVPRKYDFMSSKYVENTVSETFAKYVKDRFKLELDQDQTNMMIVGSRIFPSVLYYLLFTDNSNYLCNYQHRQKICMSGQDPGTLENIMRSQFFNEIVIRVLSDMQTLDSNYLAKSKGIQGFYMKSIFKIATEIQLLFSIYTEGTNFFATAGGPIEAGSFLVPTDISLNLKIANTLLALELYERAIPEYDNIINLSKERLDILKAAWNNKGLCYRAQKKLTDAIYCYNEVLKIDENLSETLGNLAICYQELGENDKAEKIKKRLENLRREK
jgi:Tetratricopeptide repeat